MKTDQKRITYIKHMFFSIVILSILFTLFFIPKSIFANTSLEIFKGQLKGVYPVNQDAIVIYRNNNINNETTCNLDFKVICTATIQINDSIHFINDDKEVSNYRIVYVPKKANNQSIRLMAYVLGKDKKNKNYLYDNNNTYNDGNVYYLCGKNGQEPHKHYLTDHFDWFIFRGKISIDGQSDSFSGYGNSFKEVNTPEIYVGESIKCTLDYNPTPLFATSDDYSFDIKWTSSDEDIATVTEDGMVTAKSKGKCYVQLTINDNIAYKKLIKVKKAKNKWKTVNGEKYYLVNGTPVKGCLYEIGGHLYIFDSNGVLVTQKFSTIDGNMYYSGKTGKVVVDKEVTDKKTKIQYIADSKGVLTKKDNSNESGKSSKTTASTKTITFKDITLDVPVSWGDCTDDSTTEKMFYNVNYGSFMIYTKASSGTLTQKEADNIAKDFGKSNNSYDIKNSKLYEYKNKKINAYYLYTMDIGIRKYKSTYTGKMTVDQYGRVSMYEYTPYTINCKSRLTTFEYNGKYYVAVMTFDKDKCTSSSFDEYTELIKSIKPASKSSDGNTKKNNGSGTNKDNKSSDTTVWITESGSCYHRIKNCGNGTYYETSLSIAKKQGLSPCGKCYK